MKCDLMHKDVTVTELGIDEADGSIGDVVQVLDADHLPVGSVVYGMSAGTVSGDGGLIAHTSDPLRDSPSHESA